MLSELPKKKGALFNSCYYTFRSALERAEISLPSGQMIHVLRHTFPSHFVMEGGNILFLQKILEHTGIKMTIRCANFLLNHLEYAINISPLNIKKDLV